MFNNRRVKSIPSLSPKELLECFNERCEQINNVDSDLRKNARRVIDNYDIYSDLLFYLYYATSNEKYEVLYHLTPPWTVDKYNADTLCDLLVTNGVLHDAFYSKNNDSFLLRINRYLSISYFLTIGCGEFLSSQLGSENVFINDNSILCIYGQDIKKYNLSLFVGLGYETEVINSEIKILIKRIINNQNNEIQQFFIVSDLLKLRIPMLKSTIALSEWIIQSSNS